MQVATQFLWKKRNMKNAQWKNNKKVLDKELATQKGVYCLLYKDSV